MHASLLFQADNKPPSTLSDISIKIQLSVFGSREQTLCEIYDAKVIYKHGCISEKMVANER